MAIKENEEVYLFERNDLEKQRLNKQHSLLVKLCHGNLLHPSIPKDQIQVVADIGTGSGIWLQDVASALSTTLFQPPRIYTGFDISDSHFPAEKREGMDFVAHDILKPFPEEYHGRFDVVHVRLLVLALKKEQIKLAAENVAALLKPQGYFQWEELETANLSFTPVTPAITSVRSALQASTITNSLTNTPSVSILEAFKSFDFKDIKVEDYNSAGREEFTMQAREWTKAGAKAALYHSLLKGEGKGEKEAREMADRLLGEYEKDIDGGVTPTLPFVMVLGRKG